jgi:hypothetical protein
MCFLCLCTCLILSFSAWLHSKDLSSLKSHEIEAFLADEGKKRNQDLREGYRIALNPNDWLANNEKLRQAATQQELDAQEQVDQLNSESEDAGDTRKGKGPKKRKRDSDEELSREKKAPKSKKDSAESKKKAAGGKSRKNGRSKSVVESEDDGQHVQGDDDDAGPSKNASSPQSKKAKREKDDDGDDCKHLLLYCPPLFDTWHSNLFLTHFLQPKIMTPRQSLFGIGDISFKKLSLATRRCRSRRSGFILSLRKSSYRPFRPCPRLTSCSR